MTKAEALKFIKSFQKAVWQTEEILISSFEKLENISSCDECNIQSFRDLIEGKLEEITHECLEYVKELLWEPIAEQLSDD